MSKSVILPDCFWSDQLTVWLTTRGPSAVIVIMDKITHKKTWQDRSLSLNMFSQISIFKNRAYWTYAYKKSRYHFPILILLCSYRVLSSIWHLKTYCIWFSIQYIAYDSVFSIFFLKQNWIGNNSVIKAKQAFLHRTQVLFLKHYPKNQ